MDRLGKRPRMAFQLQQLQLRRRAGVRNCPTGKNSDD